MGWGYSAGQVELVMSFVSTGFPAFNRMLAGNGGCAGFPRGGLTLLGGAVGSGKSQVMRECCARAHRRGLKVVYIDTEGSLRSEYPSVFLTSLDEVQRLMAQLLHPGKKDKTDLLVLDCVTQLVSESEDSTQLGGHARQLGQLFRVAMGQTAVVGTLQSRRTSLNVTTRPSASVGYQASVILNVSNNNGVYNLELSKSKVSSAGVSCEIRLDDLEEEFDRSKIQTRYQRILRGRYQTPHL